MTNELEIHPGNTLPNHDNMVNVVIKTIDGEFVNGAQDCRLGRRSWTYWKNVVMWQEIPLGETE